MLIELLFGIIVIIIILTIILVVLKNHLCVNGTIELTNKHIVITGGSRGIGRALAFESIKKGALVTIIARNINDLESTVEDIENEFPEHKNGINLYCLDITCDVELIQMAIDDIELKYGDIDILVNCAGYSISKEISDTKIEEFRNLYECNCLGSVKMIKCVQQQMIERHFGQIVLISSICGQFGIYGYSAYCMSKFALRGLAECLSFELFPYNIGVTIVYPPDTDTEGFLNENKEKPIITKLISESGGLVSPNFVATKIIKGIQNRQFSIVFGFEGFIIDILTCGCSPINTIFSSIIHFFFSGIARLCFLFTLKRFYTIVKQNVGLN